jgi:uroporphyrinogen-III synthase
VETAIARLRAGLGTPKAIQTVVKRGYRLAIDPAECTDNNADTAPPAAAPARNARYVRTVVPG